ncbi:hypothetical protein V8G54_003605 [Vigna mungo]|uniref:Retrotransposon gag domain-containing protein n=1 Tax=Vigna mungo TaxID=3915 RepID=A0AAQ3PAC0_VIGMU
MQHKHAEEITALRVELGRDEQSAQHSASTVHRNEHHENENHGRQTSQRNNPNGNQHANPNGNQHANSNGNQHGNPDGNERGQPVPPQTIRPTSFSPFYKKSRPVLEKYDGSADPDNHLRIFTNAMAFYTDSDPIICRAFSLSLKDEALEWYNTLPPNLVDCFPTVETLFKRQYSYNRKQEIISAELVNTKQEKGETLKAFMKRYIETTRQVKDVNHSFIINNLPSCLRPGYFAEKLYTRSPKTMDELQERVAEFICIEDMRISQRKQQETYVGGNRKDSRRSFGDNDKGGGPQLKDFPRTPKFSHYTTVNAPREKILKEALNAELLSIRTLHSPRNADGRKHCHYH